MGLYTNSAALDEDTQMKTVFFWIVSLSLLGSWDAGYNYTQGKL